MLNLKRVGYLLFLSSLVVYAGGDNNGYISSVADVSAQTCVKNKVYTEKDAQLMWQDEAYTDAEDGAYKRHQSVGKAGSWNHAMNYCTSLDYQGYSDWRLPTADELRHIHHKSGQAFTYHRTGDFWTSTPSVENKYYVVYPVDAFQYKRKKSQTNYIRCVRCWIPERKSTLYGVVEKATKNIVERGE